MAQLKPVTSSNGGHVFLLPLQKTKKTKKNKTKQNKKNQAYPQTPEF